MAELVIGFVVGGVLVGALAWLVAAGRVTGRAATARAQAESLASAARAQAELLAKRTAELEVQARGLESELREAHAQRAAIAAHADAISHNLVDQRRAFEAERARERETLGETFQSLAADALRTSQEDFLALASERLGAVKTEATTEIQARSEAQQKALEGMVTPVRTSLEKLDEQVRVMERERGAAYGALSQHMKSMSETQVKLLGATGSLVSALKAPAVRGRWGEIQLRRVVELAGMLEHCDFEQQVTVSGEDGRLRPDMVVRLPGGRNIVVDAKVPLGAYLEAREAGDEETRAAKLRQHAGQVQQHITKLSAKSYWEGFASRPELVLMFLPAEPLYSVALEQMPGLLEEGFAQGVLIATPTTLLGLLRAMSFGWREERLAESAQKISAEGRKLHEKVATVVEHLASLGNALNQSVKHYNRFLHSFEGRVVVSARRLAELDAKGRKDLGGLEEIQVRATRSRLPEETAPAHRSAQQPLLSLAPPAPGDRQWEP